MRGSQPIELCAAVQNHAGAFACAGNDAAVEPTGLADTVLDTVTVAISWWPLQKQGPPPPRPSEAQRVVRRRTTATSERGHERNSAQQDGTDIRQDGVPVRLGPSSQANRALSFTSEEDNETWGWSVCMLFNRESSGSGGNVEPDLDGRAYRRHGPKGAPAVANGFGRPARAVAARGPCSLVFLACPGAGGS